MFRSYLTIFLILAIASTHLIEIFGYVPMTAKDHYLSDVLIREIVDRMGKDLAESADSYVDSINEMPSHLALMARASKDLEAEQMDYDTLLDTGNPNPSLRDQEYLQHSSLWGHQYVSGGAGEGPHRIKPQIKTDASLPAYCNPPNPCPYGYTEDQGCIQDFENTAAFSREYQAAQECMCDSEHMFDCSIQDQTDDNRQMNSDIESFLARQFHNAAGNSNDNGGLINANNNNAMENKNLIAKKFHPQRDNHNPFLQGEKLPIAAKKGINVY